LEIVSTDPDAGEACKHVVALAKNGRVRSVFNCVEREETIQEWSSDEPPTLKELADLLVEACRDEYYEIRSRLLSAVVHGLLPQGDYLWPATAEIPDAVLDESLSFGPRTSYRAEIQKALVAELRVRPETAWAVWVQSDGTAEQVEFARQIAGAVSIDPEWLHRSEEASKSGKGTPFDDLVARNAAVRNRRQTHLCSVRPVL
jgi:hypothetical protein